MDEVLTRFREVFTAIGKTQTDFAKQIGVTPAYIWKLLNKSDITPSDRTINDICREFNISEHWLRTGEGEMFVQMSRDEEIAAFMGDVLAGEEDNFRRRFIAMLSKLNEDQWEVLEQMIDIIKEG